MKDKELSLEEHLRIVLEKGIEVRTNGLRCYLTGKKKYIVLPVINDIFGGDEFSPFEPEIFDDAEHAVMRLIGK